MIMGVTMVKKKGTPTFNLKAVVRETGLRPDTLRAWERRYGLPQPQRTSGGHRVYSHRDIKTLKWLIARQEEGLSISRAVELWRQLEADDRDPLVEPAYAVPDTTAAPAFLPQGEALSELRHAWLSAALEFNETAAEQALTYALALYPAETVCIEILLKGLAEIGEGWYRGNVTVQQEHFISELSMRRLEAMMAATPAPTRPGRVLVGCAPEETHTFPPLLLAFLLKQRGWETVYLGARVPAERFDATVASIRPHLVVLTAQRLYTASTLLEVAATLRSEGIPLAFGGGIFNRVPQLRQHIPGHFLGERLEMAPQAVEELLTSSPPVPAIADVSETYRQALDEFDERLALVEAEMWKLLGSDKIARAHISIANEALTKNIVAALSLGDINLLWADIAWVEGLLENRRIPRELLHRFLNAYYQAAKTHLNGNSTLILDYLAQLKSSEHENAEREGES